MAERPDLPRLDLRALGEVESPEVVHGALRRFRRRALARVALVLAVIGFAVWFRGFGPGAPSLESRIESAEGRQVGAVFQVGEATVVLQRVADLGDTTGLVWTVADPRADQFDDLSLGFPKPLVDFEEFGFGPSVEISEEVVVPASGTLVIRVERDVACTPTPGRNGCRDAIRRLGTFTLDLPALGLSQRLWR